MADKRRSNLFLLFLPAIGLGLFGLFVQIIRYEPLHPKKPPVSAAAESFIPIYEEDPILGDKRAPMTVIMFADLGCAPCQEQVGLLEELMSQNPKKVKVIWKGLPVTRVPISSARAHDYAFCAGVQNRFSAFHTAFVSQGSLLADADLEKTVPEAELNEKDLATCLASEAPRAYAAKTEALAQSLNIQAVPAIFVNNKQIDPPRTLSGWVTLLAL